MTIKLYTLPSNRSSRMAEQYLRDNELDYVKQQVNKSMLTWDQYLEILSGTEYGIEDILSVNSAAYKEFIKEGVDFDELTIREFYSIIQERPTILKFPIMYGKETTMIGFNETKMKMWLPRKARRLEFLEVLNKTREYENANGTYIASHTKYN